jgi:hypothetical protein
MARLSVNQRLAEPRITVILSNMLHRFFALFLLSMLPLQASWAAIAPYCNHETAIEAQHFGHHEHNHDHSDPTHPSEPNEIDSDCAVCHSGWIAIIFTDAANSGLDALMANASLCATFSPHGTKVRPERPNWLRLVSFG